MIDFGVSIIVIGDGKVISVDDCIAQTKAEKQCDECFHGLTII